MNLFKRPRVKFRSDGSWSVDVDQLMESENFKKQVKQAEELYNCLKEAGHNVKLVKTGK